MPFLFLAGIVLALSVARRRARGDRERTIDGDIFKRGIFILLLDPLWMSIGFGGNITFQVLYRLCRFIFNNNVSGIEFWKNIGWTYRKDINVISKTIEQANEL